VRRIDPQHVAAIHRRVGRRRGGDEPRALRDALRQAFAADLIEVVAERDHHRVLARPPDAFGVARSPFEPPDETARLTRLAEPPPPLPLAVAHRGFRQQRDVNSVRFVTRVRPAGLTACAVGVLVGEAAERMTELVGRNERAEGIAAGGRREAAADAAVGVAVGDDQDLIHVRRRPRRMLLDDCLRRLRDGDPARIEVRTTPSELQLQRSRAPLADLRIAVDARLAGHDLHPVDVEVAAVASEGLDAPQDVEVLV
jgi:hypothetical protein